MDQPRVADGQLHVRVKGCPPCGELCILEVQTAMEGGFVAHGPGIARGNGAAQEQPALDGTLWS